MTLISKQTITDFHGWKATEAADSHSKRRRYLYWTRIRGHHVEVFHQPDEIYWKFSWGIGDLRGVLKGGEPEDVLRKIRTFVDTLREFNLLAPSAEELKET